MGADVLKDYRLGIHNATGAYVYSYKTALVVTDNGLEILLGEGELKPTVVITP